MVSERLEGSMNLVIRLAVDYLSNPFLIFMEGSRVNRMTKPAFVILFLLLTFQIVQGLNLILAPIAERKLGPDLKVILKKDPNFFPLVGIIDNLAWQNGPTLSIEYKGRKVYSEILDDVNSLNLDTITFAYTQEGIEIKGERELNCLIPIKQLLR